MDTGEVLINIPEEVMEGGPEQDFDEVIEEARWKLFNQHSDDSERPLGDDTGYIPPSHRWLSLVREAAAKLAEAEAMALKEIPRTITREMKAASFRGDGISTQLERGDPEVRRLHQVSTAAAFVEALVGELANEGRPRALRFFEKPAWLGKLAAKKVNEQRRDPARAELSHSLADLAPGRESRVGELKSGS